MAEEYAISDAELAMLNTLIYQDGFVEECGRVKGQTLDKVLENLNEEDIDGDAWATQDQYLALVEKLKENPSLSQYTVKNIESPTSDNPYGHKLCLTRDNNGDGMADDMFVVYEGTTNGDEWKDNMEGLAASDTPAQQDADRYLKQMLEGENSGINLVVSGHSKGGNKSQYVTVLNPEVDRCVSFDGQGFSDDFLNKYSDYIPEATDKIINYYNQGDFVSCLLNPIAGEEQALRSGLGDLYFAADNHAPINLLNGNLELDETKIDSSYRDTIRDFTLYIEKNCTEEDQAKLIKIAGFIASVKDSDDFSKQVQDYLKEHPDEAGTLFAVLASYPDTVKLLNQLLVLNPRLLHSIIPDSAEAILALHPELVGLAGSGIALVEAAIKFMQRNGASKADLARFFARLAGKAMGLDGDELDEWVISSGKQSDKTVESISTGVASAGRVNPRTDTPRDFSDSRRQELLDLVKEVESEHFWEVSKWDVWYRAENIVGGLNPANYANRMDEYFRKEIDINGTSAADIERIFADAAVRDGRYGSELQGYIRKLADAARKLDEIFV